MRKDKGGLPREEERGLAREAREVGELQDLDLQEECHFALHLFGEVPVVPTYDGRGKEPR